MLPPNSLSLLASRSAFVPSSEDFLPLGRPIAFSATPSLSPPPPGPRCPSLLLAPSPDSKPIPRRRRGCLAACAGVVLPGERGGGEKTRVAVQECRSSDGPCPHCTPDRAESPVLCKLCSRPFQPRGRAGSLHPVGARYPLCPPFVFVLLTSSLPLASCLLPPPLSSFHCLLLRPHCHDLCANR